MGKEDIAEVLRRLSDAGLTSEQIKQLDRGVNKEEHISRATGKASAPNIGYAPMTKSANARAKQAGVKALARATGQAKDNPSLGDAARSIFKSKPKSASTVKSEAVARRITQNSLGQSRGGGLASITRTKPKSASTKSADEKVRRSIARRLGAK